MFDKIEEIKRIQEQRSKLAEREKELTEPALTDLDMIGQLYGWFKEIMDDRNCAYRKRSAHSRRLFILIVLYLYSPSALIGGRLRPGIRERLAHVLGCHPPFISNNIDNVLFYGQRYKPHRQAIDNIYIEIINRLKINGLING